MLLIVQHPKWLNYCLFQWGCLHGKNMLFLTKTYDSYRLSSFLAELYFLNHRYRGNNIKHIQRLFEHLTSGFGIVQILIFWTFKQGGVGTGIFHMTSVFFFHGPRDPPPSPSCHIWYVSSTCTCYFFFWKSICESAMLALWDQCQTGWMFINKAVHHRFDSYGRTIDGWIRYSWAVNHLSRQFSGLPMATGWLYWISHS